MRLRRNSTHNIYYIHLHVNYKSRYWGFIIFAHSENSHVCCCCFFSSGNSLCNTRIIWTCVMVVRWLILMSTVWVALNVTYSEVWLRFDQILIKCTILWYINDKTGILLARCTFFVYNSFRQINYLYSPYLQILMINLVFIWFMVAFNDIVWKISSRQMCKQNDRKLTKICVLSVVYTNSSLKEIFNWIQTLNWN